MIRLVRMGVLLLLMVAMLSVSSADPLLRILYPLRYQDSIAKEAALYGLDPFMVAAVIRVESRWNKNAVSPKGAVGLMQLMPDTARWIAEQLQLEFDLDQLHDPQVNIRLGVWYLQYLRSELPTFVAAIAAYNAGPGNVVRWLENHRWDGRFATRLHIPFIETRSYVRKVVYAWNFYRIIYKYSWDFGEE